MSRNSVADFKRNVGQSMFEVLFAVAIASLILVGIVSLAAKTVRNTDFSKNNSLATKYAQEVVEWLREERDSGWTAFAGKTGGGKKCFGDLGWTYSTCSVGTTIFKREVDLVLIDPDTVEASIYVNWDDPEGTHQVKTITRFTNWNK